MKRVFDDPRRLRRLAPGLIATGALLGLAAAFLRDRLDSGSGAHSATYLLDTAGWLVAILGAIASARLGSILFAFQPTSVRRRATIEAIVGIAVCLLCCVILSAANGASLPVRLLAAALLIGGLGLGLAGLFTHAVTVGSRYAADRLAERDDY